MSDSDRIEISAQDLMPGWVTNLEQSIGKELPKQEGPSQDRGPEKKRGKGGGHRREGNRGRDDRDGFRGRGRDGGGRGGPGGKKGRYGNRDRDDHRQDRKPQEPVPKGLTVSLEPSPLATEALARHIKSTGRAYALADVAKMVLGARDRYQIRFASEDPEKYPLFFCSADNSLWLSQEEAAGHLLGSTALNRFYEIEEVPVEPPKGNFSVVAVCGFSGRILGPPNHHEYSMNVARLHRERFSDMPLERFKSRIEMRRDEETIEQWKSQVSTQKHFRPRPEPLTEDPQEDSSPESEKTDTGANEEAAAPPAPEETAPEEAAEVESAENAEASPPEDSPAAAPEEADAADEQNSDKEGETPGDESPVAEEDQPADASPEPEPETEPTSADTDPKAESITNAEELARHFRSHFADQAIQKVAEAVLPGKIPGRFLARPLLNLLKTETDRQKKAFPLSMIQHLCREFEKSGLKFFKRGKKALHVSVARPRAIANEEEFTDRVRAIVHFVRDHPRKRVVDLLDALVPDYQKPAKGESIEQHKLTQAEHDVLADLRWLAMEGYVIEFPSSELTLGKMPPREENRPKQSAKPRKGEKKATGKPAKGEKAEGAKSQAPTETAEAASAPSTPPSSTEEPSETAPPDDSSTAAVVEPDKSPTEKPSSEAEPNQDSAIAETENESSSPEAGDPVAETSTAEAEPIQEPAAAPEPGEAPDPVESGEQPAASNEAAPVQEPAPESSPPQTEESSPKETPKAPEDQA